MSELAWRGRYNSEQRGRVHAVSEISGLMQIMLDSPERGSGSTRRVRGELGIIGACRDSGWWKC